MDQKLLESLGNLSLALEEIASALKDKSEAQSATAKAMKGGDFIKEIKEINKGVIQLQKDTKEILKNQQTIMKMGKQKKEETTAERLGGDKKSQNNFKDGIKVILLIAVAVLAIGAAFLLIGKVNFLSVIALSIALPLLAIGFAKVHTVLKEVGFDPKKDAVKFIIAVTSIAMGIMLSSYILSMVSPLSFAKFITSTFIALMFAMLAPSIMKFMMAFKEMSWMQLIKSVVGFPLILPAIALGIAFASWALQLIKPISFTQFLTAVGIGIVFAIISFGIRKMLKSFQGLNIADIGMAVIFLPLILPAVALGIALSSYALQLVKPIGFIQFLSAVGIAIVFTVIAYGIRKILKSFEGMDPATMLVGALMIPVLFVAVSYAIAYSSEAFSKVKVISFAQFLTSLGIAAVFVVISYGIAKIAKGIAEMKWSSVPKIPVLFVLVSLAIALSSYILDKVKPMDYQKIFKIGLFGIALAGIVFVMSLSISKLGQMKFKDLAMGVLAVVLIAVAIMVSSHILALGNYKGYPDWKWSLSVALSLVIFGGAAIGLGFLMAASGGLGFPALALGALAVVMVAATITAASFILGLGKYGNYPPLAWSASVALSLGAFSVGMIALGTLIFATFGIGGALLAAGSAAVLVVADTIVQASFILNKGIYTGGPTLEWAGGIALSLAAFSPIYAMLMANGIMKIFGGGGVGPDEFATAIKTVSEGIVTAAGFFANNKSAFVAGPSKEWAEGIGIAIGAFAPVYKVLADNSGWMASGVSVEDMAKAIMTISQGIVDAAKFFAENKSPFEEGNYPSEKWGKGVGAALGAFAPVFKAMNEDRGWFESGDDVLQGMLNGIYFTTSALVSSAQAFFNAGDIWGAYPTDKWASGVKSTVVGFMNIFKEIEDRGYSVVSFNIYSIILRGAINNIATSAKILFDSQKYFKFKLDPSWVINLGKNVLPYAAITQLLDKMLGYDEKTTLKKGGFFGIGQTTTTVTTRKMKDVSIINRLVSQMIDTAKLLTAGQKFFNFKLNFAWVQSLGRSVLTYAGLTKALEAMLTTEEKVTTTSGFFTTTVTETVKKKMTDVSITNRVTSQMVSTAGILYANRKFFGFKIDPNYMKAVASNVLTFADLANQLAAKQKGQSKFDEFMGMDPISRAARGMVKIASAYDALAKAVKNFSAAINSLNVVKLYQFRMLTGNLAMLSAMDSGMFSNMLKVLETRAGVFSKLIDIQERRALANMPQVRASSPSGQSGAAVESKKSSVDKDAKGETALQKLDRIAMLLTGIRGHVDTIDMFLQNPKAKNDEIGKGDG